MVHVNSFLGCANIETGGFVLAWLHIILYGLAIPLLILEFPLIDFGIFRVDVDAENNPGPPAELLVLVSLFLVIVCVAIIVIAYRSINAIKVRNYTLMFEMMALMFAITCAILFIFVILLWLRPIYCLVALITAAIYYYLFLVIYSLYRVFRKEHELAVEQRQKANA